MSISAKAPLPDRAPLMPLCIYSCIELNGIQLSRPHQQPCVRSRPVPRRNSLFVIAFGPGPRRPALRLQCATVHKNSKIKKFPGPELTRYRLYMVGALPLKTKVL